MKVYSLHFTAFITLVQLYARFKIFAISRILQYLLSFNDIWVLKECIPTYIPPLLIVFLTLHVVMSFANLQFSLSLGILICAYPPGGVNFCKEKHYGKNLRRIGGKKKYWIVFSRRGGCCEVKTYQGLSQGKMGEIRLGKQDSFVLCFTASCNLIEYPEFFC